VRLAALARAAAATRTRTRAEAPTPVADRGLRRRRVVGADGRRAATAADAVSLEAESVSEEDPDDNAADAASSVASSRSKWNLGRTSADADTRRV